MGGFQSACVKEVQSFNIQSPTSTRDFALAGPMILSLAIHTAGFWLSFQSQLKYYLLPETFLIILSKVSTHFIILCLIISFTSLVACFPIGTFLLIGFLYITCLPHQRVDFITQGLHESCSLSVLTPNAVPGTNQMFYTIC